MHWTSNARPWRSHCGKAVERARFRMSEQGPWRSAVVRGHGEEAGDMGAPVCTRQGPITRAVSILNYARVTAQASRGANLADPLASRGRLELKRMSRDPGLAGQEWRVRHDPEPHARLWVQWRRGTRRVRREQPGTASGGVGTFARKGGTMFWRMASRQVALQRKEVPSSRSEGSM